MLRTIGYWFLGFVGFLAACELGLRALPVSSATLTGYYTDPLILTYPAHHRWQPRAHRCG